MRTQTEETRLPERREIARRLRREGLLAGPCHAGDCRRFSVAVLDLEAADIRRWYPGRQDVRTMMPDDRLRRIVTRAAVRALYVLGLDAGQVVVDTDERGRAWVAGVSDQVRFSSAESRENFAMASAARSAALAEEKAAGGVCAVLGADPEFVLTRPDGKVVSASKFLPPEGWAGCDSIVRRGVKLWPLAELRPEPSPEPSQLADGIRRLLAEASRRIGNRLPLIWRAGARPVPGLPLGGHIHVSGALLTGERLRALDNAVALPLRLLEPPGASARRPRYGVLGDFRRKPHGGFEYRTPPSWLVSHRLALGVLTLAKIAVEHAEELAYGRPLDDDRLRDAFYGEGQEPLLREAAIGYFERIRRTAGYYKYREEAEYVFEAVQSGRAWDESADFRSGWGLLT
jgi:hypothetical protein